MYKCGFCHQDVSQRMDRVVTRTREKMYDGGFRGWEIAEEVPACRTCVELHAVPLPSKFANPDVQLKRAA